MPDDLVDALVGDAEAGGPMGRAVDNLVDKVAAGGAHPVDVVDAAGDVQEDVKQGPVRRFLGTVWGRMTKPTRHKPEEYGDRRLTRIINVELDGGTAGPAHEAQLGHAVVLVVEHVMAADGDAETPLGHLMAASTEYGYRRWDAQRGGTDAP